MNHDSFPLDAADEEASLWAARLEGASLSASDRDALDAWLAADPAHRPLLAAYCQFSADLEEQLPLLVATGLTDLPPEKPAPSGAPRPLWWISGLGVAAAAAVAVAFLTARAHPSAQLIATAAGQRQTITLDDGTRVELNARTSLKIENTAHARHVQLAEGEAFFTVAKDKTRPFTVETPAGSVRVTGTVFDVRSETTAQLDVTVVEGSVQVRPGSTPSEDTPAPYLLTHNQGLEATGTSARLRTLSSEELSDTLAWRDGLVVADQLPIRDAIARFARYHGRGMVVTDAAAAKRISGRYNIDDLDSFLADLQQLDFRVDTTANGMIRVDLRAGN